SHKMSCLERQRAFERVMPEALRYEGHKSLDWFFDGWINGNAIPQFSLQNVHMTPASSHAAAGKDSGAAGKVKVTGVIAEDHAARDMVTAIPVYAVDAAGKFTFLAFVFADDVKTEFTLTAPAGTREIVLDPEDTLLKR